MALLSSPRPPISKTFLSVLIGIAGFLSSTTSSLSAITAPSAVQASMTIPLSWSPSGNPAGNVDGTGQIYRVSWTDNSSDEGGFQLGARFGTSGAWSYFAISGDNAFTITANSTSTFVYFSESVIPPGQTLQFAIRAFKGPASAPTEFSTTVAANAVKVFTHAQQVFNPASNLKASVTETSLGLTWTDNSTMEENYMIEFKEHSATDYSAVSVITFNSVSANLDQLLWLFEPTITYDIRVRALRIKPTASITTFEDWSNPNNVVFSDSSNVVTITMPFGTSTALAATAVDEKKVNLQWLDYSGREQGYAIDYWDSSTSTFTTFNYAAANATSYQVTTGPGATFQWRISAAYQRSNNAIVNAQPSNIVTATTPFLAPTQLQATTADDPVTGVPTVHLTWQDNSHAETGYQVLIRTAGTATFQSAGSTSADSTSASLNPTVGTTYEIAVRAVYQSGDVATYSDISNLATATVKAGITSRLYQPINLGQSFSYTVQTAGTVSRTGLEVSGLPAGLTVNSNTGVISGTPTESGVFNVAMTATFADGQVSQQTLVLRVVIPSAAPILPTEAADRTIGLNNPVAIPLSELFADPSAESAVRVSTSLGDVDIILYPSATPETVANFMSYVQNGDYNGVAFHRAIPGFVVQGGAFKPVSAPDQFSNVVARPSPINEPGISNVYGTVAMAKLGGLPNSATHDFFFNIADNNSSDPNSLDNQNGGFTVFGRVAGNGMNVVNSIVTLPQGSYSIHLDGSSDLSGPYANWPMLNNAPSSMDNTQNVLINSVTTIPTLSYSIQTTADPDTIEPVLAGPGGGFTPVNVVVNPGETAPLPDFSSQATASDNVGVEGSITQTPEPGTDVSAGNVFVTLHAFDAAGNEGILNLITNINDGTLPEITAVPADRVITAGEDNTAPAPDITGEVGGPGGAAITQSPAAGTSLPVGRHDITLTVAVTDEFSVVHESKVITHVTVNSGTVTGEAAVAASIAGENLMLTGLIDAGQRQLTVKATDLDGNTVSQTFTITVQSGYTQPSITQQPVGGTVARGSGISLTVQADGTGTLSYQWLRNGVKIPDATGSTLDISSAQYADAGSYTVAVSNLAATITSNPAVVTVEGLPAITQQPASIIRNYGASASFSVQAVGSDTLSYQWIKGDSTEIPLATSSTLTIPVLSMSDAGSYKVRVTNSAGPVTSEPVTLTVSPIDSDGDGATDDVEITAGTNIAKTDTDGDGISDGAELALGSNPLVATSTPSNFFIAQKDGDSTLRNISLKRISQGTITSTLDGGSSKTVVPFWMAGLELTNRQFASVLQRAYDTMKVIQIVTQPGGRRAVMYQGEVVCLLATELASGPGNLGVNEVDIDSNGQSFYVPNSIANNPVRGITWHGAYFATVVLNNVEGYTTKCSPATWSYDHAANGYYLPRDYEWEWVGRAGTKNYAYPTGTSVATSSANYNAVFGKTKPVGSYAANSFGIQDLAGNVAEWVFDTHDSNPANGYTRGGGWADPASALANNARATLAKTTLSNGIGVRLALKDDRAPSIATPPAPLIVANDQALNLSVGALGAPPLTYQWLKNNASITGQTKATLSIASPKTTDAGAYTVKVTNGLGTVTSTAVNIGVVNLPANRLQSVSTAVAKPVSLTVPVAGTGLQFQWFKDGTAISAGAMYTIANTTSSSKLTVLTPGFADTGIYSCRVSSSQLLSPPAPVAVSFDLKVLAPPVLMLATPSAAIVSGTVNYSTLFDTLPNRQPSTFLITGLPAGLTYSTSTGLITGKPTKSGTYTVTIKVTNAAGSDTKTVTFSVADLPTAIVGTFNALVDRDSTLSAAVTSPAGTKLKGLGGSLSNLVVTSTGVFTASLKLEEKSYTMPVNSKLEATPGGNATASVTIPRGTGIPALALQFTINATTGELNGTLSDGLVAAPVKLHGWRNVWKTTATTGSPANPATALAGAYNAMFDFADSSLDANPTYPQGHGYATVTVTTAGLVTWSGVLADGTAFTYSTTLGPNGEIPLHSLLYTPTVAATAGSVSGWVQAQAGATFSSNVLDTMLDPTKADPKEQPIFDWMKQPQSSTSTNYRAGIPLHRLKVIGGGYIKPATGVRILNLANTSNNAMLTFASAGVEDSVTYQNAGNGGPGNSLLGKVFTVNSNNTLTMPSTPTTAIANPATLAMSITTTTGAFNGSFVLKGDPDPTDHVAPIATLSRTVKFYGLLVPRTGINVGAGYFLLPQLPLDGPPKTTLTTSPVLSGQMLLEAAP